MKALRTTLFSMSLLSLLSAALPVLANERPVKDLKEIEKWNLGTWTSEEKLLEDVPGFGKTGTPVQGHAVGTYTHRKKFLRVNSWIESNGQKLEAGHVFFAPDPETGNIKSWFFDYVGGLSISGPVFVDGDTFFLRAEGRFLPRGDGQVKQFGTDLVPWQSELVVTVVDADTVKFQLNYVKFSGKPFPYPGVGVEVVSKRVK